MSQTLHRFLSFFPLAFALTALAQEGSTAPLSAQEEKEGGKGILPITQPEVPTPAQAARAAADQAATATKAAAADPRLDALRARARSLREKHAEFHAKVARGELDPHQDMREKAAEIAPGITRAQGIHQQLQDLPPGVALEAARQALHALLQEIGPYLEDADALPGDGKITREQHAELLRLYDVRREPDAPQGHRLQAATPTGAYTLIGLPVPLAVRAEPGTPVYFEATNGGALGNGLPLQEVEADKSGLARTTWVSKGGAVSGIDILATSPQADGEVMWGIDVVQLTPQLPPAIPTPKVP